jgi:glyoxylase-like metal-dependent hydrolase (beta-lactamase superfamily II)
MYNLYEIAHILPGGWYGQAAPFYSRHHNSCCLLNPDLTHGHGNHIGQANQFSTIFFPQKDAGSKLSFDVSTSIPLIGGQKIDLGGVTLKAYSLPGHTIGSMVFISPEKRLLFTGDAVGTQSSKGGLWLQLPGSL